MTVCVIHQWQFVLDISGSLCKASVAVCVIHQWQFVLDISGICVRHQGQFM